MTKRCPRCELTKPIQGGFYVRKNGEPSGWCRSCWCADMRERRRSTDREQEREYQRRWLEQNADKSAAYTKRMREQHRDRHNARQAANIAIRAGRLTRPTCCELCGTDPGVDRRGRALLRADHYRGYAREHWLDVRFICPTCDGLQIRAANDARRAAANAQPEDHR